MGFPLFEENVYKSEEMVLWGKWDAGSEIKSKKLDDEMKIELIYIHIYIYIYIYREREREREKGQ